MPAIDIDRDTAHQAAQRELDKPIYPKGAISQRIQEWIHELLYRIVEKGSSVPGGWLTITVLVMLLIAAVVVAVRIARRTIRARAGGDYHLFDAGQLTAAQHRAIAERFAAEEDWAAAIRHRLRAVARGLEENGTLEPLPGRTASELATDAAARLPALGADLSRAASAFNDVAYGATPGTRAAYQLIAELDGRLHQRSAPGQFGASGQLIPDSWAPVR